MEAPRREGAPASGRSPRHLDRRTRYPGCEGTRARTIFSSPYAGSPILAFLQRYYGDRITPDRLEDADYVLDQCLQCSLVFQRFVPRPDFLIGYVVHQGNPTNWAGLNSPGTQTFVSPVGDPRYQMPSPSP